MEPQTVYFCIVILHKKLCLAEMETTKCICTKPITSCLSGISWNHPERFELFQYEQLKRTLGEVRNDYKSLYTFSCLFYHMQFSSYFLPLVSFGAVSMTLPSLQYSLSLASPPPTTNPNHYCVILETKAPSTTADRQRRGTIGKSAFFGFVWAVKYTGKSEVSFSLCDF